MSFLVGRRSSTGSPERSCVVLECEGESNSNSGDHAMSAAAAYNYAEGCRDFDPGGGVWDWMFPDESQSGHASLITAVGDSTRSCADDGLGHGADWGSNKGIGKLGSQALCVFYKVSPVQCTPRWSSIDCGSVGYAACDSTSADVFDGGDLQQRHSHHPEDDLSRQAWPPVYSVESWYACEVFEHAWVDNFESMPGQADDTFCRGDDDFVAVHHTFDDDDEDDDDSLCTLGSQYVSPLRASEPHLCTLGSQDASPVPSSEPHLCTPGSQDVSSLPSSEHGNGSVTINLCEML